MKRITNKLYKLLARKDKEQGIPSDWIDIPGGKFTFGQRIDVGEILRSDRPDAHKLIAILDCIHKNGARGMKTAVRLRYLNYIMEGFTDWFRKEEQLLKHEVTPEEREAGITELSRNIGDFGTVKSIAKTYGKDPDEVLRWEYAKVFGILYTDLEEHKFSQRYNNVMERRNKK